MSSRLLVVDDEQSVLDVLSEHLEGEGHTCICTTSPLEALEIVQNEDVDLLLTDLRMPEMNGIDLVRQTHEARPEVVIVVVTALVEVTHAIDAMRVGANDYVLKPFDLGEISISVRNALERRRLRDENRRYQRELEHRVEDTKRDLDRTNVYFENLLNSAVDAIIATDADGKVRFANRGATQLLGQTAESMKTLSLSDLLIGGAEEFGYVKRVSQPNSPMQNYETEFRHRTGETIPVSMSVSMVEEPDGSDTSLFAICKDITEQKRLEAELKEMTIRDNLTGLYNQRYFYDKLRSEIERAKRQKYPLTLLFIDIDKFKSYNDSHDHLAGDHVLEQVGHVIRDCTREHVDLGFRYGGDEFTVILPEAPQSQARQIAERIRMTFEAKRFDMLTLSIGLMTYEERYSERAFLQFTDSMMYEAKRAGGNQVRVYDFEQYAS